MPAGDRTGPRGLGPMTGRGMGYCRGYDMPGYANLPPRRGFGMGWGGGRGRGWGGGFGFGRGRGWGGGFGWGPGWGGGFGYYPPPSAEDEAAFLHAESSRLKQHLEDMDKRLAEIEKED
jgi:hypothetical protein